MAADLDRAGRGHSGRAGIPAGPGGIPPGSWASFAGREDIPAGLGEYFIVFRLFWD